MQRKFAYPVRIAVVDKNQLVVRGLKSLLEEDGRFEMVASASDGGRLLDGLEILKIDIVITGWVMPYLNGEALLRTLNEREGQQPSVVVYTGDNNPAVARQAMELGAAAFFSKSEPPERLLYVLDTVARGSMVFPMHSNKKTRQRFESLTPKERLLLKNLKLGLTNKELAEMLGISTNTIKFHLRNIYSKLNIRNRSEAVVVALSEPEILE